MKILGSPGSPFVRKVRIIAAEKGIPVEYVIERPNAQGSRIPTLNPLGKIPVLLPDDGEAIYDSSVIAEYLDGIKPEPRLIPAEFGARIAVKRWEALGDGVADATVMLSHDWGPMHGADKQAEWITRQEGKVERSLAAIQAALAGRDWLHGSSFTLADISAGYALYYLDQVLPSFAWRDRFAPLAGYAERLYARKSFRDTVPVSA
jgi:glutathione S-transferase